MNYFRISNQIFDMGLAPSEAVVYAYLCSIHASMKMLNGNKAICVKQSTIAQKCSIRSLQTVRVILTSLCERGLVEPVRRLTKRNGNKGTYEYELNELAVEKGFFMIPRKAFGILNTRQMFVYMFLCKAESSELNKSWNSYNDIAKQIGMKREMVVKTISELVALKQIVRMRRKSKENNRVFVDNHYQIIRYVRTHIRRKKKSAVVPQIQLHGGVKIGNHSSNHNYDTTNKANCQVFFSSRGSP